MIKCPSQAEDWKKRHNELRYGRDESMKLTFIPVIAAIVAVGLLMSPNRSCAQESKSYTTRQPSSNGRGGKVGVVTDQCPDNYYISAFQTVKDNNNQRAIRVWCKPLPKVDAMPSNLSESKPLHSKEPASEGGGAKIECPDRYYFSGFQFRVDAPGGLGGQRSIDLWCKPFPKVNAMPSNLAEIGPDDTGYDPFSSGGSKKVESPDGYFISAIQIWQATDQERYPARRASVWYRPVRPN
jgi:hypothetical protein